MKEILIVYLKDWSLMRIARLVLGVIILVQGWMAAESISMLFGAIFAGMALANIGCNGACAVNSTVPGKENAEIVEYEEVVIKK